MITTDSHSSWSESTSTSSLESSASQLMGEENDAFIPTPAEICQTFHDGLETWNFFLNQAKAIPSGQWPLGTLDPYITLLNVPCMPERVPDSTFLYGRSQWRLLQPESPEEATEPWDPTLISGPRITFMSGSDNPILCSICSEAATPLLDSIPGATNSHAVLTMCWSYILSVRFLEMQERHVFYTKHRVQPNSECTGPYICLDGASPALVRWLCGILCSDLGWSAEGRSLPPWAACLSANIQLITNSQIPKDGLTAPSSWEATNLLLELCQLFALQTDNPETKRTALPPCRAAFLAALMLPFYRYTDLRPQFPPPKMYPVENARSNKNYETSIYKYLHHIKYFMTLSLRPQSLGSILWSAFWQPDIDCNLVSPWLASMLEVLDQTINTENLEIFIKVLTLRRPRTGIWWLALFLLGDDSAVHWFRRYAETQTEKRACGSLSQSDIMVSAWTGSKQSFLDCKRTKQYKGPEDLVSRDDWLRCKLLFKLQDASFSALSWRPFGKVKMQNIEPELWPYLTNKHSREYDSFVWYHESKYLHRSLGFRRETRLDVEGIPDDLERRCSETRCHGKCQHDIKLEPSKASTLQMLSLLVHDATGSRHWANAEFPSTCLKHEWLRHWQGLDSIGSQCKIEQDVNISDKPPSWYLKKWVRHQFA